MSKTPMNKATICCLDLEGVLMPEIWIRVSEIMRIKELRLTTRDEPDYDLLMKRRLRILRENKLKLRDIQDVIKKVHPLPGARAFLDRLRLRHQVILLSDTYYQFMPAVMTELGQPTLFCNHLRTDRSGYIASYHLRQKNGKEKAVRALKGIGFNVKAAGDSFNDLAMLRAADAGFLFNPPDQIARDYSHFPVAYNYRELLRLFTA